MVMPEPMSWKTPVIIDAVFGATDDPDMQKSFAVYCMMAPAPDILCTVANSNDRTTAFTKALLEQHYDYNIAMTVRKERILTESTVLPFWGLRFLVGGKHVVFGLQFRVLVECRGNVEVVSLQPSALQ